MQLQLATELDPGFARAWVELARAYESSASVGSANWESAGMNIREAAEKAIILEPKLASAHLVLVDALNLIDPLNNSAQIKASILKASELEPNNAYVLEALGWLKIREGKLRESLPLAEKAVLINPLDTDLQIALAYRRAILGQTDQATSSMARIAEQQPDDLSVQMDYLDLSTDPFAAEYAVMTGKPEQAIDFFHPGSNYYWKLVTGVNSYLYGRWQLPMTRPAVSRNLTNCWQRLKKEYS